MKNQNFNHRPVRRTTRRDPSGFQLDRLAALRSILHGRRNKRRTTTFDLLRQAGYEPQWRRVVWTGGVGSYRWMPRRRRYRILVAATKSGLSNPTVKQLPVMPGVIDTILIPGKRRGYRYGWCVEC